MLRETLVHTGQYGVAGLISRAAFVLLVPIYTRILDPADFGRLDLITAFAALVNLTIALEISQGVARHFVDATTDEERRLYGSTSLWFSVAVYSAFVLVTFVLATPLSELLLGDDRPDLMRVSAIWIWCTGIFLLVQNQIRWKLDPKGYAVVSVTSTVLAIGFSIALVVSARLGVVGVIVGQTVGALFGLALGLLLVRDVYGRVFDAGRLSEMLRFSLPLVPSSIAVFVTLYIDRILIARLMTVDDVGLFGIGFRIASVVSLVTIGVQAALTPLIYKHYREAETPAELATLFRAFVTIALTLCLGLALFADEIATIFTTPPFYGGAEVVPILAPAVLIAGAYIFAPGLAIRKRTGSIALISIAQAVLNVCLNLALIPVLGIVGAALATLIGASGSFIAYMVASQRSYHVPHRWTPIVASVGVTASLYLLTRTLDGTGGPEIIAELGAIIVAVVFFMKVGLAQPQLFVAAIRPGGDTPEEPASANLRG